MDYTATLTYDTTRPLTDDQLAAFALQLEGHAAAVSADELTTEVTLSIDAFSPWLAGSAGDQVIRAAATATGIGLVELLALEVLTIPEHDRRLAQPAFPAIVGVSEIAEILGVTRQRASALQTRPGFPEPLQVLASGPVWLRSAIDRFASTWERKGGRPRKDRGTITYTFYADEDPAMALHGMHDEIELPDGARGRIVAAHGEEAEDGRVLVTWTLEPVAAEAESARP